MQPVQQGAEQVGQHLRQGYESTRDELERRYRAAEGMMGRHPMSSVMFGFGLGFGLGLVLTVMLGEHEHERDTWSSRHVPDRLRRLPDSLHDTLEQLADSVRNLPEALKSHMPAAMTRR
jgi:hypothetical protein